MSWCPPRHRPPCSSLLLMSETPLLLFPPLPLLAPVPLPFFCILFFSCSLSQHTPLPSFFFFALSPGVSPSSPHKEERRGIRASADMTCMWGAAGTGTLTGGGKVPLLPLMRPLTAVLNTMCVCVGGGSTHACTHTSEYRCKHKANNNNKQTQWICGSRCATMAGAGGLGV